MWIHRWSGWDSSAGRTRDATYEGLPTSPVFFLGGWQWPGVVCASFVPSRSWELLVTPAWPTSVSPSLDVLGSHTQISWRLHGLLIQAPSAAVAFISLPLLLLQVVTHPDLPTPAPFVPVLMFLLQFSTRRCKIQLTFFVCNFVKVYTNLSYLWTNTAPFSLTLLWKWLCSDAKINFPSQEKDPSYNG